MTATATDPDGIQITVDSDDPTTPAPNDPTVTEMDQIPSMEVIKTAVVIDNNGDGKNGIGDTIAYTITCLLYTSPSPRDRTRSRMPSSA